MMHFMCPICTGNSVQQKTCFIDIDKIERIYVCNNCSYEFRTSEKIEDESESISYIDDIIIDHN